MIFGPLSLAQILIFQIHLKPISLSLSLISRLDFKLNLSIWLCLCVYMCVLFYPSLEKKNKFSFLLNHHVSYSCVLLFFEINEFQVNFNKICITLVVRVRVPSNNSIHADRFYYY